MWAAKDILPKEAAEPVDDPDNDLVFSAISIFGIAAKFALRRPDFTTDPQVLRRILLNSDYTELAVTGDHAAAVTRLPFLHKDPFDRLLAAQAGVEGITLLTGDATLATYPAPIRLV